MPRPREFDPATVVDAAMETFWTNGYEATTTQHLCESTGLGKGSLYNAFGSKQSLYHEAIRRYAETKASAQLTELARGGPVRELLRDLMLAMIEVDLGDPGRRGCLALNAATETAGRTEEVRGLVRAQFDQLQRTLTELIAAGQASGELRADRPAVQVARTFQSSYYGLRALANVTDERAALLDVVDGAVGALG